MRLYDLTEPLSFKIAALASSALSAGTSVAAADWTMGIFGVPFSVFLAGFSGALVSLSFMPPPAQGQDIKTTVKGMVGHVIGGTFMAAFLQPLVLALVKYYVPTLDLAQSAGLGIAGVLGALAMVLIPIGINWLRVRFGGAT